MYWVVGGTTFDLFATNLPYLPVADSAGDEFTEKSLVHVRTPFIPSVGGNAGNAAVVLARLGADTRLISALADDVFGAWLMTRLTDVGVHLDRLSVEHTSVNVVLIDSAHRLSAFQGATMEAAEGVAAAEAASLGPGDAVLVAGYPHPPLEVTHAWLRRARDAGSLVAFDIGPSVAGWTQSSLDPLLPSIDVLFANADELSALPGDDAADPLDVAAELASGHDLAVICKRGAAGATHTTTAGRHTVSAYAVTAGLTVGAGDAFNAGFLRQIVAGQAPDTALRYAAGVAACVLERGAGVLGAPTDRDVTTFMRRRAGQPSRVTGGDEVTTRHSVASSDLHAREVPNADEPSS